MTNILTQFWMEDSGQDLIEYTLLLAFVALVSAGIFIGAGQATSDIWVVASSTMGNASTAATS